MERWRIVRLIPAGGPPGCTWSAESFEAENMVDARRRAFDRIQCADKGLIEKIEVEQVAPHLMSGK